MPDSPLSMATVPRLVSNFPRNGAPVATLIARSVNKLLFMAFDLPPQIATCF